MIEYSSDTKADPIPERHEVSVSWPTLAEGFPNDFAVTTPKPGGTNGRCLRTRKAKAREEKHFIKATARPWMK